MSTTKLDTSGLFQPVKIESQKTKLSLASDAIRFRKNGIEFRMPDPIAPWTEMTVDLQSPRDSRRMRFMGVVVDCRGNRHTGFVVSIMFMNLSRQSQDRLNQLALTQFA